MRIFSLFRGLPLFVFLALTQHAAAWSSIASKTSSTVRQADLLVAEYRSEFGRLPDENEFRTYGASLGFPPRMQARFLIDGWGRPLVYRSPGRSGGYDLYSMGRNGIDDHGEADDITTAGPNEGYYWKRYWPIGRLVILSTAALGFVLLVAGATASWRFLRPLAGAIIGAGLCGGAILLLHPGVVPGRNYPLWGLSIVGALLFLASLRRV